MNKRFIDFYEAYTFLLNHNLVNKIIPGTSIVANHLNECLTMDVVKVNPETSIIEINEELNTKTEIWLEFGEWCTQDKVPYHDTNLDCGADTFEEAVIILANLVDAHYNDDGSEK